MLSFIITGFCGIALNVLIGRFYGAEYLGAFNLSYAVYIFLSQLAVFGIHLSVLKYVSHSLNDPEELSIIASSAIYLTIFTSLIITVISYFLGDLLIHIFKSQIFSEMWPYLAFGLIFFALNKILLNILNGQRHLKLFSIAQSSRTIFALLITLTLYFSNQSGEKLGLLISLSEFFLFFLLLYFNLKYFKVAPIHKCTYWVKKHFNFGRFSLIGGIMNELNTRVDVLVLGVFVSDKDIGIYTIALMIFEGFVQLTVVFRNNYNPLIAKYINEKKKEELTQIIKRGCRNVYLFMAVCIFTSFFIYPYFIEYVIGNEFQDSNKLYQILMIGVLLTAGYLPFDMLLTQAGYPLSQSFFKSMMVACNVLLNFFFINLYGLLGAAIATALVYSLSLFLLKFLVYKKIKIKI